MFHAETKQTRGGYWTPTSSMMKLFVTILCQEVIAYWQNTGLSLCAIISSVSMIKLKHGREQDPGD